jgi:hypothetical protein
VKGEGVSTWPISMRGTACAGAAFLL